MCVCVCVCVCVCEGVCVCVKKGKKGRREGLRETAYND